MASKALIGIAVLAGYLALGTLLAVAARRRAGAGERDFYIAGGRLGGFLSAMTYAATTYSTFMIVGLVGFAYATGYGALGFEMAYYIATIGLLLAFSRRVWRMARERGWVSPGEMLADLYGSRALAVAASVLYLVALVPYASSQLKGIGEAVAGLAGGSPEAYKLGVVLGVLVMLVWSLLAGLWSVAVTDALQGLWMLAAATALLGWVYGRLNEAGMGLGEVARVLEAKGLTGVGGFWTLPVFLAFTLPWVFFAVTNPQVVQRLYAPRDEASLARMIRWFAVFGLYYTILVTLIGLMARAGAEAGVLPYVDPREKDKVTPTLLGEANPLLAAAVFTSIVAAGVSTADSILLTLASSASRDLAGSADERTRRIVGILAAVGVAAVMSAVAAQRVGYIVGLAVLSSVLLLPLAPVTIAAWLGFRPGAPAGLAGLVAGVAVAAAGIVYYRNPLKAFVATPLGLPLSAWVLVASSLPVLAAIAARRAR